VSNLSLAQHILKLILSVQHNTKDQTALDPLLNAFENLNQILPIILKQNGAIVAIFPIGHKLRKNTRI
jgi:hypothetical protein